MFAGSDDTPNASGACRPASLNTFTRTSDAASTTCVRGEVGRRVDDAAHRHDAYDVVQCPQRLAHRCERDEAGEAGRLPSLLDVRVLAEPAECDPVGRSQGTCPPRTSRSLTRTVLT